MLTGARAEALKRMVLSIIPSDGQINARQILIDLSFPLEEGESMLEILGRLVEDGKIIRSPNWEFYSQANDLTFRNDGYSMEAAKGAAEMCIPYRRKAA